MICGQFPITHWLSLGSGRRACGLALGIVLLTAPAARSQEAPADDPVVRVEEDWVLVLNEPNDDGDSPQFHTVMSPYGHTESAYAQVLWNYAETPSFEAGGVQLQSWNGESLVRAHRIKNDQLSTSAETITWTQALELDEEGLFFEVTAGQSTTWGDFGRDMKIQAGDSLPDLSGYDSGVSVANTCITYGSNRVDTLKVTQVRRYHASGQVDTDDTARVVYQSSSADTSGETTD